MKDLHKHIFLLCFDLLHSRVGISSMFDKVPLSLSQAYITWTQRFYLQAHKTKQ